MKIKKRLNLKILLLIIILLMSSGFRCKCVSPDVKDQLKPITINYWGVWNDRSDIADLIDAYRQIHPNITINYKKFRYEEYERLLLDAWAEGRGPDIFSIHNTWVSKYEPKIAPLPKKIEMPHISYRAPLPGCKKKTEEIIEIKDTPILRISDIEKKYTKTVYKDVILGDPKHGYAIYALPLSLDILALFYNVDLLDKNNIPFPPDSWDEFIEDVRLLTRIDIDQNIIQAGAALGAYSNIERAFDIISLLFLQNGADLNNIWGTRAQEAMSFYLDFANPQKEVYSWNNEMVNSLDAFVEGKLAFFFGYSYHIEEIKSKSPNLNFAISTVPQVNVSDPVNYANYWVETVYKKSEYSKEAWDFILFLSQEENLKKYLKETKQPAAIRGLMESQLDDPEVGPFASQVLTADSWHGYKNFNLLEDAFGEMFEVVYENSIYTDNVADFLNKEVNPEFVSLPNLLKSLTSKVQRAKE